MAISKHQVRLEKFWYNPDKPWWLWLFLPFYLLLRLIVFLRRGLYRFGLFKSTKLSVPVIVIGNINVGGTGKTPLAIYLLKLLKAQGYRPGLVTRGYSGKAHEHPLKVEKSTEVSLAGDEPVLIFQHTLAPVMVDPVRARGGQALIDDYNCDIIICDDGLQHYALARDLEILVIDNERQFGNGWLMPFGPLREPLSRAESTDIKVVNGLSMLLQPRPISSILDGNKLTTDKDQDKVFAVAGIGNPQRFFRTLRDLELKFLECPFPDHHHYIADDFSNMDGNIIMTEKDAVKCKSFADQRFYYLPVEASLESKLEIEILSKIKQLDRVQNL